MNPEVALILEKVPFFKGISEAAASAVAGRLVPRRAPAGTLLFRKGEAPRGDSVVVKTVAQSKKNRRAPAVSIDYTLSSREGGWRVYDVTTDGVSLVSNYRTQFNDILSRRVEGQSALIVLMAYAGCYVPASSAELGPFDRIFSRIGASDDLAGGTLEDLDDRIGGLGGDSADADTDTTVTSPMVATAFPSAPGTTPSTSARFTTCTSGRSRRVSRA